MAQSGVVRVDAAWGRSVMWLRMAELHVKLCWCIANVSRCGTPNTSAACPASK